MKYKILSWNVNGIRAIEKKGFVDWLVRECPFLCCVQESKAQVDQLNERLLSPEGYHSYWSVAERKGYSGVGAYCRLKPLRVEHGFGIKDFDSEGRILLLEFEQFFVLNLYVPNGGMGPDRLEFKLNFYQELLRFLGKLKRKGKTIIVCGDINTAHTEIDLARPKENENNTGFLPEERAWIDRFIAWGLVDTFRQFHKEPDNYTWWDYKTRSRERNVGWRLDYFLIDRYSVAYVKDAFILRDVMGSDHCPIGVIIEV